MLSRRQLIAEAPPVSTWPSVDVMALDEAEREKFTTRADAMRKYFAGDPIKEIEALTGVIASQQARLARKCLLPASDGLILGFRALLRYTRLKQYTRLASESAKFPEARGGQAGMLVRFFLRFPDIEEYLIKLITKDPKLKVVPEYRIRFRDAHRVVIRLAREKGLKTNEWPFNTKYLGKRSFERYMRNMLDRNFARSVRTRENQEAQAHLSVGTGYAPFLIYDEPYAAVELDAYDIESYLTVTIKTPQGTETEMLLDKIWLIAMVECFSSAILAYRIVYGSQVNADDVLGVIRDAATGRWAPRELSLPIKYPSGGGLPNGVIPEAHGIAWTTLLLDGALAHLSKAVHERARKALGFSVNWGPVGHFERRPNVEKTFDKIGRELYRRLPSTKGGGPHKGRAIDAQQKALRYRIREDDAAQVLDVTVAQHNCLPCDGNFGLSPLEVLRQYLQDPHRPFLARVLSHSTVDYTRKFAVRFAVTVRGGISDGRRPYVQLDGGHYTNPVLADSGHLIGKKLIIEVFDEDDYRQVRAYLQSGAEFGVLNVQGKWARTKHSRRTRKAINSLVSRRLMVLAEFDDPVHEYMKHNAQLDPQKKQKTLSPRQVTILTKLSREAGHEPRIPAVSPTKPVHSAKYELQLSGLIDIDDKFFNQIKNGR